MLTANLSAAPVGVGWADGVRGLGVTCPCAGVPTYPWCPHPGHLRDGPSPPVAPEALRDVTCPQRPSLQGQVDCTTSDTRPTDTVGSDRAWEGLGPAALTRRTGWRAPLTLTPVPVRTAATGPPSKCLAGTPTPSRAAGAPLPTFARSSGFSVAG